MTAAAAPAAPRTHASVGIIFTGLMLVLLLAALDSTIVATALPTIVGDLGGLEHISWVTSAYLLAQTVVTPLYGKLGDLYGRKRILQVAVVIFLIGSALCGLAQSMPALIAFRAVQGFGAGGLIVLTQAVIGDVVSPRERGRYQGIFGAVFGLASVAGPLLGGFIVEQSSWRWIFYVNLPIGLLALVVLAVTLPATRGQARPVIDYLGTGLLATGLSAIVLVTSLGGTTWEWASVETYGTAAIGVGALAAFALVELRVPEPVLPPALWRERVFTVSSVLSLIVGFALFGAVTFLPLYSQTVDGATPTESGLQLLPMMVGVLIASIGSGQAITRFGRYKAFPVAGTAVMAVGLFLLSRLETDTSRTTAAVYMLILGLGLGLTMQVLVLAVQNAVPYAVLGSATSGVTLMRGVGGSVGTAVFGAIFTNRLTGSLSGGGLPPELERIVGGGGRLTGEQVQRLPAPRGSRTSRPSSTPSRRCSCSPPAWPCSASCELAAGGAAAAGRRRREHTGSRTASRRRRPPTRWPRSSGRSPVPRPASSARRFHRRVAERAGVDAEPGRRLGARADRRARLRPGDRARARAATCRRSGSRR